MARLPIEKEAWVFELLDHYRRWLRVVGKTLADRQFVKSLRLILSTPKRCPTHIFMYELRANDAGVEIVCLDCAKGEDA